MLYRANSDVRINGATVANLETLTTGDQVDVAIDLGAKLVWFRKNGGDWNNDAGTDPATGVGGISTSYWTLPMAPAVGIAASGNAMTLNFGATAYTYAKPTGFLDWPGV